LLAWPLAGKVTWTAASYVGLTQSSSWQLPISFPGLMTMQAGSLLQGVILTAGGTLIALACITAMRSHRYIRRIADNTLRYRLGSSTNVDPGRLVPILKGVLGVAAAIGAFVAIVGILAVVRDFR
jgi:hypothetical protein